MTPIYQTYMCTYINSGHFFVLRIHLMLIIVIDSHYFVYTDRQSFRNKNVNQSPISHHSCWRSSSRQIIKFLCVLYTYIDSWCEEQYYCVVCNTKLHADALLQYTILSCVKCKRKKLYHTANTR